MLLRLLPLLGLLACPALGSDFQAISARINARPGVTWSAEPPLNFANGSHVQAVCGTWLKDHPKYQPIPETTDLVDLPTAQLPREFSWVQQRPDCPSLQMVRDQSDCGSCWAFSATETFNDRRCIHKNDTKIYSTEDTAACCDSIWCGFSMGCNGGQPGAALSWMSHAGVVTGGPYSDIGTGKSCRPYTLAPCAHHVKPSAKYPKCPPGEYPTPKCRAKCSEATYPTSYANDKTKGKGAYSVTGVNRIMSDLYTNGPLSVALTVYEDFPTYKSGVYSHHEGMPLGGHAVEMVGWGEENGIPYWMIKNSWNDQWGLNGYIKIKRGVNECGIEGEVHGVKV